MRSIEKRIQLLKQDQGNRDNLLIFADWFEEHGIGEIAAVLRGDRLQCASMAPAILFPSLPVDVPWKFVKWIQAFATYEINLACDCGIQRSIFNSLDSNALPATVGFFRVQIKMHRFAGTHDFVGAGKCSNCDRVFWTCSNLYELFDTCNYLAEKEYGDK